MITRQGSLLAQLSPDTGWKAPQVLPVLDSRFKKIGFDSETNGLNWHDDAEAVGYSFALEDGQKFYLPFGHQGGGNLDKGIVTRWMNTELKGKTLCVLAGKIDVQMARKGGVDLEKLGCKLREVQYAAALLSDQRRSFAMDDLAFDFLGRQKVKIERADIWQLPAYEVGPYAEEDAAITLALDEVLEPKIQEEDLGRVLQLENDLIWCVCEMERNGAPIDLELLNRGRGEMRRRFEKIVQIVSEATGLKVNPNSSHDLARLFNLLGIEYPRTVPTERFPTGQPSFPDPFLQSVNHELIALLREGRAIDSLESKYYGKYARGLVNGFLYYQLHQLKGDEEYGTIAGRFSSSGFGKGLGANIQQVFDRERQAKKLGFMEAVESGDYSKVPWLVRNLFIPAKGKKWFKADASQIEFRGFVHYSRSQRLIDVFCESAAKVKANDRLRGTPQYDPTVKDVDFHQQVADFCKIRRKNAKNYNFARLFGAGKDKTAAMLGLPREEADKMYAIYDEKFPETRKLMDRVMGVATRRGYVRTIMGRRARFPDGQRLHSALNRVIQGTAADILKRKLLQVYNVREELELTMRFTVHDELDGDVPSEEHAYKIKEVLEEPIEDFKFRVPLLWDVKVGENWGACS